MQQNFLNKIIENKLNEVAHARQKVSEHHLSKQALQREEHRSFKKALISVNESDVRIIAEIKRASPSKGLFRENLDTAEMLRHYETAGAVAISVLTERTFFLGKNEDLKTARRHTKLPVLRKDFIISEYQVFEAAAWGADAVLLIVRILTPEKLNTLLALCRELHMDALVEVYATQEIQIATDAGADIIGLNNRNLETFQTDIQRAIRMAPSLKPHQIPVVASGISCRKDILRNTQAGLHNFLIGERLVLADDPQQQIRELMGQCNDE